MCGIAGFVIAPDDLGHINTKMMLVALGYEMKSRGTDATGIYTCDAKGRWKVRKQALPADVFLAYRNGIGNNAQSALLHTRAATQGKASNPDNNHPITYDGIVGVHNGIVWNDDKLFDHYKWPRIAQVDSEAIFAALAKLPHKEALENIDGSWAIAWADTDVDPRKLWLCRGDSSPLFYATTQAGSVVFASTSNAVVEAFDYGGIKGKPTPEQAKEGFLASVHPDDGLVISEEVILTDGTNAIGKREKKIYVTQGGYYNGKSWSTDEEWRGYHHAGITTPSRPVPANPKVQPALQSGLIDPFEERNADDPAVRFGYAKVGDCITIDKQLFKGDVAGAGKGYLFGEVIDSDDADNSITVHWRTGRISRHAEYEILMTAEERSYG